MDEDRGFASLDDALTSYGLPLQDERHFYEKCQYADFMARVARLDEFKAQNPGQRFN